MVLEVPFIEKSDISRTSGTSSDLGYFGNVLFSLKYVQVL